MHLKQDIHVTEKGYHRNFEIHWMDNRIYLQMEGMTSLHLKAKSPQVRQATDATFTLGTRNSNPTTV